MSSALSWQKKNFYLYSRIHAPGSQNHYSKYTLFAHEIPKIRFIFVERTKTGNHNIAWVLFAIYVNQVNKQMIEAIWYHSLVSLIHPSEMETAQINIVSSHGWFSWYDSISKGKIRKKSILHFIKARLQKNISETHSHWTLPPYVRYESIHVLAFNVDVDPFAFCLTITTRIHGTFVDLAT